MSLLLRRHILMGSGWHPLYRAVLERAVGAGYALPSYQCMQLQNTLVTDLVNNGCWGILDYFYVYAHNSGDNDMARINWVQPLKSLSTGTPTYVAKKGLYGTIVHDGFNIVTDRINMTSHTHVSMFCFLTENGGAISTVEALVGINNPNLGSGNQQTIRLRTNPRVDYLWNSPTSGAAVLLAGLPSDNHLYQLDTGNPGTGLKHVAYVNASKVVDLTPSGGALPDTGNASTGQTFAVTSARAVGLIGGGGSFYANSKNVTLYNTISQYMTAVQALP